MQPACADVAQTSVLDSMPIDDPSEAVMLLQVNSMKVTGTFDVGQNQTTDEDQATMQDLVHDMQSAMMLMDVNFGVLGDASMLLLNKSRATSLIGIRSRRNLNDAGNWVDVNVDDNVIDVAPLSWVFGSYHKTGCQLALGICWVLGGNAANNIEESINHGHDGPDLFNNKAWSNWFFEPDLDIITSLNQYRFVHMIRMPATLVVSAYRYHCQTQVDTEDWLRYPMNDPYQWCMYRGDCKQTFTRYGILPKLKADINLFRSVVQQDHQELMQRFFQAVDAGQTLPEYYSSVPPTEGVVVEVYRSFTTLNMMADNYERTRNDNKTVQLRMENIKADFQGSMRCMFNFLYKSHKMDLLWLTKRVDPLNVEKYGSAADFHRQPWHINHDDNTELFQVLSQVAFIQEKTKVLSLPAVNDC